MFSDQPKVLYAGTVLGKSFHEQLEAARSGRFGAISVFPQVYHQARKQSSDADLRAALKDHGLVVSAVEPLLNWVPGEAFAGSRCLPYLLPFADDFFRIAEALEAQSLVIAWARKKRLAESQLIDAYAALCLQAARHGLNVHLEFLPWTQIADAAAAVRIVTAVAQDNAGVMFDSWHHARSGMSDAQLQNIDASAITAIQLSDAPAEARRFPQLETLRERRLPGEGDIKFAELLRTLASRGCRASLGVEVFSSTLRRCPAREIGRRASASLDTTLENIMKNNGHQ